MEEYQILKDFEDQIIDVLLILRSTSDTIVLLAEKYRLFLYETKYVSEDRNELVLDSIAFALQEKEREVGHNKRKVESLHTKVQGATNLVSSIYTLACGFGMINMTLAIESSRSWKRIFFEAACRRSAEGQR